MTNWYLKDLRKWIEKQCPMEEGCEVKTFRCKHKKITELPEEIGLLTNLENLYCHNNKLTCLPNSIKNLKKLKKIICSVNKLTFLPPEIGFLQNLEILDCSFNGLIFFPPEIGLLTNLQILYCDCNVLLCLPNSIKNLKKLKYISCSDNKLTNLPPEIGFLQNLEKLVCSENKLTFLPQEIGQLQKLRNLCCHQNKLEFLPPEIGLLQNLQNLGCSQNELTYLPPEIGNLRRLQNFSYSGNRIEYIPPNILNMLNRQKTKQGIYSDSQSVHNHNIQSCITKSINYILSIKPNITNLNQEIINNEILTQNTKELIFEYLQNKNIHSVLNITFENLFLNVFSIILNNPAKDEILKILNIEMQDSQCKCFTGRISRLVNVLNGFDENIKIEIAENEQIGNIILVIKNRLNPYDLEVHKELVKEELEERGYGMETIEEWLNYIE